MDVKQVLVIRKDLKMRRGKEIAQGAHASMAWLANRLRATSAEVGRFEVELTEAERAWVFGRLTKVCVQIDSEAELRAAHEEGRRRGIACELIIDSGRTEFGGVPTPTCCAVGPALAEDVDQVTRALKLY